MTLVDSSSFAVRLTVWGRTAETFEAPGEPVIAFKGVKVGDFGGRSLSMISSSTMVLNPDIGEAHSLRGWYDSEGNSASLQQYSNTGAGASTRKDERRLIAEVRDNAELGQGEKPDYFAVRATVMLIRDKTVSYPACPTDKCNKKLVMEGEEWRCEKCDRSYEAPEYRSVSSPVPADRSADDERSYMLSLSVGDHTGQIWLSSFNDVGQLLIGISAGQLEDIKNDDETAFAAQLQNATLKMYDFSCRAKAETYQEVSRVKYSIMRASPVDFAKAGHELVVSPLALSLLGAIRTHCGRRRRFEVTGSATELESEAGRLFPQEAQYACMQGGCCQTGSRLLRRRVTRPSRATARRCPSAETTGPGSRSAWTGVARASARRGEPARRPSARAPTGSRPRPPPGRGT